MAVCADVCRSEEDALAELGGVSLQHDVHLAVPDWAAWLRVSETLSRAGAEVRTLRLTREDAGFAVRCRLQSVSAEAARTLVEGLLSDGLAQRAAIEHLVLAAKAGSAP